jgi:hypothetical protein
MNPHPDPHFFDEDPQHCLKLRIRIQSNEDRQEEQSIYLGTLGILRGEESGLHIAV